MEFVVRTVLFYYFIFRFLMLGCLCPLQSRQKALADLHQMQNVHVSYYFTLQLLISLGYWIINAPELFIVEPFYLNESSVSYLNKKIFIVFVC